MAYPRLDDALRAAGGSRARAHALLHVAISGLASEQERAWLAAGLLQCELGSPVAATTAFRHARPRDGIASLAARRLEDAFAVSAPPALFWVRAAGSPWLEPGAVRRLQLRCAETAARLERWEDLDVCLPPEEELRQDDRRRVLAAAARRPDTAGQIARDRLVIEFPATAEATGLAVQALSRFLPPPELATQARGWLVAGRHTEALHTGRRAGVAGSLTAARAAIRLRRATEALALIQGGSAEAWAERAEAHRIIAWTAERPHQGRHFADALRAAEAGLRQPAAEADTAARLHLLAAEALTELERFAPASSHLASDGTSALPRFDWVQRRWHFLQGRRGRAPADTGLPGSTRTRRLAAWWVAAAKAQGGDTSALRELADGGFPDLPAQWAAQRLQAPGVSFSFSAEPPNPPGPPHWADDLLTLARTADIAVAWRAEIEAGRAPAAHWLGLVALTRPPAVDAIPLLIRGEPRLLGGPWQGLPAALAEQYLPLPWRGEVETAARNAGIPPWVLAGLVRQESAWNPRARSGANALGLAQILPAVAREAAPRLGLRVRNPADLFDPATNLAIGARLLADWRRSFGGAWEPAIASYNAGERRVRVTWERSGARPGPQFVEAIELPETHDYVHRVVLLAEGYRALYWPEGRPYPWM